MIEGVGHAQALDAVDAQLRVDDGVGVDAQRAGLPARGAPVAADHARDPRRRVRRPRGRRPAAAARPDRRRRAGRRSRHLGPRVLVSGVTVVAGMFLAGSAVFVSFAVGTILVVAVAMVGSVSVLRALISKLGEKGWIEKGRRALRGQAPPRDPRRVAGVGRDPRPRPALPRAVRRRLRRAARRPRGRGAPRRDERAGGAPARDDDAPRRAQLVPAPRAGLAAPRAHEGAAAPAPARP